MGLRSRLALIKFLRYQINFLGSRMERWKRGAIQRSRKKIGEASAPGYTPLEGKACPHRPPLTPCTLRDPSS